MNSDVNKGGRVPDDTRFRIGSVTMVFTATVVLQLAGYPPSPPEGS